jgi:hypothetical protein
MTAATLSTREHLLAQVRDLLEVYDRTDLAVALSAPRTTRAQRFNHLVGLVRFVRVRAADGDSVAPLLIATAAQCIRWLEEDPDREDRAA